MEKETIKLNFVCPKVWDDMKPKGDGRFCGSCQKVVTDYTALPKKEILKVLSENTEKEHCGHFYTYQLDVSHHSWKDKLVRFYEDKKAPHSLNKISNSIVLALLFIVLISTGCVRRRSSGFVSGKMKVPSSRTMGNPEEHSDKMNKHKKHHW